MVGMVLWWPRGSAGWVGRGVVARSDHPDRPRASDYRMGVGVLRGTPEGRRQDHLRELSPRLSSGHGGPDHARRPDGRGRARERGGHAPPRGRPAGEDGGPGGRGGGRRRPQHRPPPGARQAARARADRPAARPRRPVPRAEPAGRRGPVRRRRARRRDRHRHRPRQRGGVRGRRQRRDGQGRHLLPDDGQEAPAGPGDRPRESPAVPLPGRQRRGLPAAAGRGLPRPRPLRPHLLQPGAHVGRRASPRWPWSWAAARPAARTCRR